MRRVATALALCAAALAVSAAPALGAADRAEYVAQVDPICQAAEKPAAKAGRPVTKADKRLQKTLTDPDLTKRELRKALNRYLNAVGRSLSRINSIFGRMIERIATVPPAPGDELTVQQWIEKLRLYKSTNDRAIRALKRGKPRKALQLIGVAGVALDDASALVADFGFQHCA